MNRPLAAICAVLAVPASIISAVVGFVLIMCVAGSPIWIGAIFSVEITMIIVGTLAVIVGVGAMVGMAATFYKMFRDEKEGK